MSLPIDRTAKSTLDANLVNGNTSDAPAVKGSNDVVYNTIDELNAKVDGLVTTGTLSQASVTPVANKIAQRDGNGNVVSAFPVSIGQNPNLMFNPSATQGIRGWTVISGGAWNSGFGLSGEGGYFSSPNVTVTGTYQVFESQKIPSIANQSFTASVEITTSALTAGAASIEIDYYNASGTFISNTAIGSQNFGLPFTKVSSPFTTPANTASFTVRLVLSNTALGSANFKKIKVEIGTFTTTYSDDNTLNTNQYGSVLGLAQVLSGGYKEENGVTSITAAAATTSSIIVTLPTPFTSISSVSLTLGTTTPQGLTLSYAITITQLTIYVYNSGTILTPNVSWIVKGT